ncbi:hypothetical protein ACFYZ3_07990 [Streptomyces sp. NPDC001599]|uniref:hypothetical protein n=1 Tax=Streptomyces sp. NPDC001599 TaxID=3364591 RepID=UPI0036BC85A2
MGRREALRCLAVGATAAAVGACSGHGSGGGPVGRALRDYAVGDWAATMTGGHEGTFTITSDGRWSETVLGLSGRWKLDSSGLTVISDGVDSEDLVDKPYLVPDVPSQASAALSKSYTTVGGWGSDHDGDVIVRTERGTVVLTFPRKGSGGVDDHVVRLTKMPQPTHEAP